MAAVGHLWRWAVGAMAMCVGAVCLYLYILRPVDSPLAALGEQSRYIPTEWAWSSPPSQPSDASISPPPETRANLWERFGMSELEEKCQKRVGYPLVKVFRENQAAYCGGWDELRCFKAEGWGDRVGNPDVLCDARNLKLDFTQLIYTPTNQWDNSGRNRQYKAKPGAFSMVCNLDPTVARSSNLGGDFIKSFFANFIGVDPKLAIAQGNSSLAALECKEVIEHPVIVIVRFEAWNLYHELGEWLNAFVTLEVLGLSPDNTQVLLLDNHDGVGPYEEMFSLFSPNHPLIQPSSGVRPSQSVHSCFLTRELSCEKKGYGTFIHRNVWQARSGEPCTDSELLDAFIRFVRKQFKILNAPLLSRPTITLIVRRDYMGRRLDRKIQNEQQVIDHIKSRLSGRDAEFNVVDFATIGFKEQVARVASSNILIGMHGAGLSHLIFLPSEAIVIELLPHGLKGNTYFRNLAKQSGKTYVPLLTSENVNVGELWRLLDVSISIASSFGERIGGNNK